VARASVVTEATGKALKAMLADLDKMATEGLSEEEVAKVKAQDRADLVQAYESDGRVARRLATLAILGLGPGFDAAASRARQDASKGALDKLANHVAPARASVIVVGPAKLVGPQLAEAGLGAPVFWDADGSPVGAGAGGPPPPHAIR
jgi:predicted Zn-dependent peptidase